MLQLPWRNIHKLVPRILTKNRNLRPVPFFSSANAMRIAITLRKLPSTTNNAYKVTKITLELA